MKKFSCSFAIVLSFLFLTFLSACGDIERGQSILERGVFSETEEQAFLRVGAERAYYRIFLDRKSISLELASPTEVESLESKRAELAKKGQRVPPVQGIGRFFNEHGLDALTTMMKQADIHLYRWKEIKMEDDFFILTTLDGGYRILPWDRDGAIEAKEMEDAGIPVIK